MKRCPNCGSTYTNDLQKFCTKDGSALVDAQIPSAGQGETIRIDSAQLNSAQLNDDEPTKVISRELPSPPPAPFDPYKTVINPRQDTSAALPRNTQDLTPAPATPPTSQPLPPSTSGPIQPPPSGSLPPSSSGPISTPLPSPPAQAPMPPATAAPRPAKKSKLPLVLGILVVLLMIGAIGAGALYWFVGKPWLESHKEPRREPTPFVTPTPVIKSTPEPKKEVVKEVPLYSPPANAVQFLNSNANLSGKLAEHYVDFSFYYPQSWHIDPEAGTSRSTNFAKMQSQLTPDAPQEIFAVGWYDSTGAKDTDEMSFPRLVTERSQQFAKTYPEYKKVSEGPTKAGPYDAYEFRFTAVYRNTERGDINIWGRVIFVPPVEGKKGVTLLMLVSSLTPEVKSVNDVGVKGELPIMLESFRFGKTQ